MSIMAPKMFLGSIVKSIIRPRQILQGNCKIHDGQLLCQLFDYVTGRFGMRFGIRRPLPKVSVVIQEQPLMVEVHRLHCQFPYKLTYSKSPNITSAGSWPRNSTRSKGTTCPKQRGNIIVRIVLIKKTTQVDKYLRKHRTRRIYNRTVLVTITQNVPDKRTRRSKNHFVSISVSSSLTKVTLECPVLSRGSGLDNNRGRFLFNHYQKWICRVQVSVKSRSRYRRRARF